MKKIICFFFFIKIIYLIFEKIYDSNDSVKSISEGQIDFNEISPSDFDVLNQRFDHDIILQQQVG
jgi:hypothetical protein